MIRGVHTMFYSSEPDALRAFLRDKLGMRATDVGLVTHFKVPGGFAIQLDEPRYQKRFS